ncbi:MAG TPA: hypothetical protein VFQ53_41160 [Kofleriaceae bacterium]|nr:hypothetical protein [Kofleriaceae bacterium]
MKKTEKKHPRGVSAARNVVRDWQPLFARLQDAIDWALDIAVRLARDYDEEIEAIERVRGYVRAWLEGRRVDIDLKDVYTTLAILFAAIELDVGIDSSPVISAMRGLPSMLHLPGAARDELPTVVIRHIPIRRRRNACGGFTQLAAA